MGVGETGVGKPGITVHTSGQPKPAFPQLLPPFETPKNPEKWGKIDSELARSAIPAVFDAALPDEKDFILWLGIY